MRLKKSFVAIAGNIGTGKTTLTQKLAHYFDWAPYFESVTDNPYLEDFYEDMNRWSLPLQVYFLSKRFEAHQEISKSPVASIQDRSIYEDAHIFARALHKVGKMSERDYQNYFALYKNMEKFLTPPDLILYVRRSLPVLLENIKNRGRDYENSISPDYLLLLHQCYEDWIQNYTTGKLLVVDADELDFMNADDFNTLCKKIEGSLQSTAC